MEGVKVWAKGRGRGGRGVLHICGTLRLKMGNLIVCHDVVVFVRRVLRVTVN